MMMIQRTPWRPRALLVLVLVLGGSGCATHFDRGVDAFEQRDYATAVSEFTAEIEERGPARSTTESSGELAAAYYERARAHLALSHHQDALGDFETAVEVDRALGGREREFAAAYQARAVERARAGSTESAMQDRMIAVRGDPQLRDREDVENAVYEVAGSTFRQGDFATAERDYRLLGAFRDAPDRLAESTRRREAKEAEERARAEESRRREQAELAQVHQLLRDASLICYRQGTERGVAVVEFSNGRARRVITPPDREWRIFSDDSRLSNGSIVLQIDAVGFGDHVVRIRGRVAVATGEYAGIIQMMNGSNFDEVEATGRVVTRQGGNLAAPQAPRRDANPIRVGQRYTFEWSTDGRVTSRFTYTVREVGPDFVIFDDSASQTGRPKAWRPQPHVTQALQQQPQTLVRERITVGSVELECVVVPSTQNGKSVRSWIPIEGTAEAFPGLARMQIGDDRRVDLVQIEAPN